MCGIYFSLSASKSVLPNDKTQFWLRSRGPDNFQSHNVQLELPSGLDSVGTQNVFLTFISTVLALRGDHVQPQPLIDADSQSVLCWNGEAWKVSGEPVEGNDTELIFKRLIEASRRRSINEKESQAATDGSLMRLTTFVSSITGPFSFVFYDGSHSRLFFSRDCLGRRSLLHGRDDFGNLKICSVYDGMSSASFEEVETDGLHMIDLSRVSQTRLPDTTGSLSFQVEVIPWSSVTSASGVSLVR
jgi:asparagine synthetase B (glutamine-hydrolysing)